MNERERRYLFEEHSPAELKAWGNRLCRFRFCRAYGGHANDGDTLRLLLRTRSVQDGLEIVTALDAQPREHPNGPGTGTSEAAPGIAQPGWSTIDGASLFIWISPERLDFTVQDLDDLFAVTEQAVAAAERIEPRFAPYDDRRVDPPLTTWHCIAPATHPELFE